jgi:small subunit ribosomal protein S9
MSKNNVIHESGKRKTAYARATLREGRGEIRINSVLLENYEDELTQLRIREPIMIGEGFVDPSKIDISINVKGGGKSGQINAIRTAISRALISYAAKKKKGEDLRAKLVEYDRSLITGDSRRTEPHKPSKSSSGPRAKRQKSYR